jgi:peptide deformylase
MTCINPKVLEVSADLKKDSEGCLSFPGLYVKIERPSWVKVEHTDENGETKQTKLEGLTARCFVHELDHMNGVKFVSHAGPVALQMAKKKQSKLIKKYTRKK